MDICLVNMPYFDISRPSLALGLLQSLLESAGVSAKTIYANLTYADFIGIENYLLTCKIQEDDFYGDWIFAHLAFPDFEPDNEEYLSSLISRNHHLGRHNPGEIKEKLLAYRQKAESFLFSIAEQVLEKEPKIVGCSSTFQQHVSSLALLRIIRDLSPGVITLLGGGNCETVMGLTTHKSFLWVDYVVSGEADDIIVKLAQDILSDGREISEETFPEGVFGPVHRIQGYPRNKGNGTPGAGRATTRSLRGMPIPNYSEYFETLYKLPRLKKVVIPGLPVQTSRGCWWGQRRACTFCGLNGCGTVFRSRPYLEVVRELGTLSKLYDVNAFAAVDNIIDMRYFKTLLPGLKRAGSPYRLFYETKSNLTRTQVMALREAGVIWIQPGIESLHSKVLSLMNKGTQAWQNIQLLKWCGQFGVRSIWHLMYDFPGEKDSWYLEMAEYFPLLTHLQPPSTINQLFFDRYSHYHSHADEYGLRLKPLENYQYVYPLTGEDMDNQAYFFYDDEPRKLWDDSGLSVLVLRPGLGAALRERYTWVASFSSDARPVLGMTVTQNALHIRDTRPAAVTSSFIITGIEKKVYMACDEAPLTKNFFEKFDGHKHSISQIEGAVKSLLDKKLLIAIDERLIALAIKEPSIEIPDHRDYPGGSLATRPIAD